MNRNVTLEKVGNAVTAAGDLPKFRAPKGGDAFRRPFQQRLPGVAQALTKPAVRHAEG